MAPINSSGALALVRYPEAPARSARTAYCSSACMLRIRTGCFGCSALISLRTSRPLRPGMEMSSSTTSYSLFRIFARVSAPLAASSQTVMSPTSARICLSPSRTIAWSSATRIRIMISVPWVYASPPFGVKRCGSGMATITVVPSFRLPVMVNSPPQRWARSRIPMIPKARSLLLCFFVIP